MVQFDEATHTYSDEHGVAKSVTQILRDCGIGGNYAGVPEFVLQRKAALGTKVHELTHFYDEDDLDEASIDDKCRPYFDAWVEFRAKTGFSPRLIEQRYIIKSEFGMRFGMTLDREGEFEGEPAIVDLKCSVNEQKLSWGTQVAGYEFGQRSLDGIERKRLVVQLKPTGKYTLYRYDEQNYEAIWMAALVISTAKEVIA